MSAAGARECAAERGPCPLARWLLAALFLGATVFAGRTLLELWRQREYAQELLGPGFPWHAAGTGAATALCAAWVLRALRSRVPTFDARTYLGLALVVGTATWFHQLAFFQPFALLTWSTAISHGCLLFGLLLWLLPTAKAHLAPRWRRIGGRTLVSLAVVPLLLEGSLRLAGRVLDLPLTDRHHMGAAERVERHRRPRQPVLGFACDARGHFDVDPRQEPRLGPLVVAIGDSFSQGCVPHAWHFTTVAEAHLDQVSIYNMGLAAIGPREYLYLLETEALAPKPDLILVNLFVGNDVALPRRKSGLPRILSNWFEREDLLIYSLPARLARLRRAHRAGSVELGEVPGQRQLVGSKPRTQDEIRALLPWIDDPMAEPPGSDERTFVDIEHGRMLMACRPAHADFSALFETLEAIQDKAGPIPVGIVLIPDEFQVEDPLWEELAGRVTEPLERFLPQRVVLNWLSERGIPALDLLGPLRAVEPLPDGRRHVYHLRDTHFNARGNRVAGQALAAFVQTLLEAQRRTTRTPESAELGGGR